MNKTILGAVFIATLGVFGTATSVTYLITHMLDRRYVIDTNSNSNANEKRDRFTICMQTVMAEARHSGKPIEAADAKEICVHIKDV